MIAFSRSTTQKAGYRHGGLRALVNRPCWSHVSSHDPKACMPMSRRLPVVRPRIGFSTPVHRLTDAAISRATPPNISLDGVIDENGRGRGGSACSQSCLMARDWSHAEVCRNKYACKHADPGEMHALIARLSSTKLCGANKSLTKSRNKLRQAAA
jgi:hypothetical protein